MKNLLLFITSLFALSSFAQQRIDGTIAFQSDPAKKYSLFIPAGYNAATPHKMMLGLHPLNTSRWDAQSWCDTLIDFANMNNLILVCPDGGADGRIDDPIDTAFTTALLDSMEIWYNIDTSKVYAMGFSWGGKTVYTYGLRRTGRIKGFMPIGAAINGTSEINSIVANADGRPFYLVHGGSDSPNQRYTPLLNTLNSNNAITNSILMPGVGHTIDFANRNQILTDAYIWIDSVNCSLIDTGTTTGVDEAPVYNFEVFPNPVTTESAITINFDREVSVSDIGLMDITGKRVVQWQMNQVATTKTLLLPANIHNGIYFLVLDSQNNRKVVKFVVSR